MTVVPIWGVARVTVHKQSKRRRGVERASQPGPVSGPDHLFGSCPGHWAYWQRPWALLHRTPVAAHLPRDDQECLWALNANVPWGQIISSSTTDIKDLINMYTNKLDTLQRHLTETGHTISHIEKPKFRKINPIGHILRPQCNLIRTKE